MILCRDDLSLDAVQPAPGGLAGTVDGMGQMGMIVLCGGGDRLAGFLRDLAPVAALAAGVVLGILYLLRGAVMERAVMSRASRRQPHPR